MLFLRLKASQDLQVCVQPQERAGSTTSCFCMSTRNRQMVLTWWRLPICLWGTNSGASNCLGSFKKTTCRWSLHVRLPLRQLRQFNNYELTMMTLKGETFAGFKIRRKSVFYFVIDVSSVILSMCIGLLRQRTT